MEEDDRLSDAEFPISEDDLSGDESGEELDKTPEAGGWASSMAKVLKTKSAENQKTIVLSKAKKQVDIEKKKEKKAYDFQVDGERAEDVKPDNKDLELALLKKKYRERQEVSL